jgi:hypothetical protein
MAKTLVRGFDVLIVSKEIWKEKQSPLETQNVYCTTVNHQKPQLVSPQTAWSESI